MFVIDKLHLNDFRPVSIPRPRDLFERVGSRVPALGTSGFTSEIGKDKMSLLADSEAALIADYRAELKKNQIPLAETMDL